MPKLSDAIKTVETSFPSIEGSKIVLKRDFRAGDVPGIFEGDREDLENMSVSQGAEETIKIFVALAQKWNMKDDNDEVAEINLKNVKEIPMTDLNAVLSETDFYNEEDFTKAEKQKLEATSGESEEADSA